MMNIEKPTGAAPEIDVADIVISVNGRDKGKQFFVIAKDDMYAMLCDGKSRSIDKPKRKKMKHVRFELRSDCWAALKIKSGAKVTNSEIRRALTEIQTKPEETKEVCK